MSMKALEELKRLRQERAELLAKARTLTEDMQAMMDVSDGEARDFTEDETKRYEAAEAEVTGIESKIKFLDAKIARREEQADRLRKFDTEADGVTKLEVGDDRALEKPFADLATQLFAVRRAVEDPFGPVDRRLLMLNDKYRAAYTGPSGMNEGVGSEGGFLVQADFVGVILDTAVKTGEILSRVDSYPIGAGFNAAKWVDVDESDVSSHVFGGVQVYFRAEADEVTASKPKIKERELKLLELMGVAYATGELEQDTTFVSALFNRAFSTAIKRKLEGCFIDGKGAGVPLGILLSKALVSVTKVANQKADSIVVKNIFAMWNRLHSDHRSNAVWLVNPDVEEQLDLLEFPVGTGGVPAYLPAGGISGPGFSTLKGRPVIPTDHCSALGDEGDIILTDLMDYLMIYKGGVQADTSLCVRYLQNERTYRFIYRANGRPKRRTALTIKNSTKTRSSMVTLDERA